jgi:hypothetical protein
LFAFLLQDACLSGPEQRRQYSWSREEEIMNSCSKTLAEKMAFHLLLGIAILLFSCNVVHFPPPLRSGSVAEAAVKYVTPGGAGARDGSSWANAFGEAEFPAAVQSADAGDEFWVAAGAYRPIIPADPSSITAAEQNATFALKNGVALYGGFAGIETTSADRNPSANVTVLTGDLADDDAGKVNGVTVSASQIHGTNSKTVVTADNSITNTTVLDGFAVTAGNNTDTGDGGGMRNNGGGPVIANCTFAGNKANYNGGGMCNNNIFNQFVMTNCTFSGNTAHNNGGGMCNNGIFDQFVMTNCTFSGNTAFNGGGMCNTNIVNPFVAMTNCTFAGNTASNGGGMYNEASSHTVTNCTFSENTATTAGGMYNMNASNPIITNCIFWDGSGGEITNNTSTSASAPVLTNCIVKNGNIGTGTSASGTITIDPQLGPLADNGGRTQTCAISAASSAIDGGLDTGVHAIGMKVITVPATDQRGVSRPQGAGVDIGAYEYTQGKILTVTVSGDGTVSRAPSGTVLTSANEWEYPPGTTVSLTASAVAPWCFVAWGGDASGTNPVITATMSENKSITAHFAKTWTITVTAGMGGGITPAGSVVVLEGASQTFTVTPDSGYAVADVTVDGVSVGAVATYTFPNVTADHTIQATFTAVPTATPTSGPTPTPSPTTSPTPSPFPSPDPSIPLPEITLTLTLVSGGTVIAGPVFITDPQALTRLFDAPSLLEALFDFAPEAVAAGMYNREASELFSILAQLDPGVTELTLLVNISMGSVSPGYSSTVFLLARIFDDQGNPTGYTVLPREEGTSIFRRSATTETWRVAVADGGATDGDPEAGRVQPNLAAVVEVVRSEAPTGGPTGTGAGGGSGCDTGTGGGNGVFGGALPVLLLLAGPLALLLQRSGSRR